MKICRFLLVVFFWGWSFSAWAGPCDCPGDLSGDNIVNLEDFAILASHWMDTCPGSAPVLVVGKAGLTAAEAQNLATALGVPAGQGLVNDNGIFLFTDPVKFMAAPTNRITDPVLIQQLMSQTENDGGTINIEGFDFAALANIRPLPDSSALNKVLTALAQTKLLPYIDNGTPTLNHTMFEAFSLAGAPAVQNVMLDTRVNYHFMVGGIPLIGPGARISFSFAPDGSPAQITFAQRLLTPGPSVPLIGEQEALRRFQNFNPGAMLNADARLVYFSPALKFNHADTLVPYYDVGGSFFTPTGQQAFMLRTLIPATDDSRYVPAINLSAATDANTVFAQAQVTGGVPPYTYEWFSSTNDLSGIPDTQNAVQFVIGFRVSEVTVKVVVTDSHGVQNVAAKTLPVLPSTRILAHEPGFQILSGGTRDFGVERGVSDLGAANQAGFVSRFLDDGVFKRFNWSGLASWERDFKEGPTGLDSIYVDNVDITFYIGHGWPDGFTFESTQDDDSIFYTDVTNAWGNLDLEWLTLLSCQVLARQDGGGLYWYQRWGPAFNGLHLMCGFQTNAYDWHDFGNRFADYTLGRKFLFITLPALPIRAAWFQAKAEEQPASVESVVMGVYGPGGLCNYNDYFWGKGPVGPDIRGSNIWGWWRVVYK